MPDAILTKPGGLTAAEFEAVKVHPTVAAEILMSANYPRVVTDCVRHLRERWDGRGYPDGLEGEGIPIEARILAVADCYVVLTSDRPYRPRYERAEALEILRGSAGSRLDPEVVEKFLRVLPMLEAEVPEAAAAPAELQPVG